MNPDPLEKDIERKVCEYARSLNILCYKFTSPARRSVPDRLFILSAGKGIFFIEFKRKGKLPTPAQEVEIAKMIAHGVFVFIVDNVPDGKRVIEKQFMF